ncbi:sensor histidine kinase [Solilutibacter silvestris]|uniref:Signal transduction histidine kinase n=1 Tax=Solilutibacter silvestris TaxID=1645665 RepID=A0A2K1Q3T3_9GAMM|nr:sensor histidine kinase [Lysobacter silvestris]PNS09710.1 Signal transduction histidine kinase [Lysobacter silvestris]
MLQRLNHIRLLRFVGMFTWALVGCWLLNVWLDPEYVRESLFLKEGESLLPRVAPWLACFIAFGAIYWWLTRKEHPSKSTIVDHLLLLAMTMCAVGVTYFSGTGLGSILLMVLASLLPWRVPVLVGLLWMLAGDLVFVPFYVTSMNYPLILAFIQSLLYVGFSGLVFATAYVAKEQVNAREEQRRINAELRGTRALLAESARVNERTRIARDLHDLLGHHLTALSMNLEVAGHLADGSAQQHVKQAHQLARLLLTDVREAVSHLREGGAIELEPALRPLTEHVTGMTVELDMDPGLRIDDPECAHVLLRSTQEIITNAVRHSGGDRLHLRVQRSVDGIRIDAEDNGRGSDSVATGNGLNGMRERVAAHGGTMRVETAPGHGFRLYLDLPLKPLPPSTVRDTA